jgi:hypothetical protein
VCCWSVGLVQRAIEAAGFTTIILTPIPVLAQAVCAPRIAAIEYPLGQTLGQPGDAAGQMAVLRATLAALECIDHPGGIVHLPFAWSGDAKPDSGGKASQEKIEEPPIVKHIMRHPWQLPRLLRRDVPV